MSDLATALRTAMAGDVRDDAYTRHLFSTDASMYSIEPLAVVFPRDAADVAAAVAVCAGLVRGESRQDEQLIPDRLEWFEDRRQIASE